MDSAADSLLALSTLASAADATAPREDDDRSSSLSELDGELDVDGVGVGIEDAGDEADDDIDDEDEDEDEEMDEAPQDDSPHRPALADGDSEAETERLEESPDKHTRKKSFVATPSKLTQPLTVNHSPNERPEIESLTESAISSPISSHDDSDDDLSDAPADNEAEEPAEDPSRQVSPSKRKREEEDAPMEEQMRARRRRTHSAAGEQAKSEHGSEAEEGPSRESREGTVERPAGPDEQEDELSDEEEDQAKETDKPKGKKPSPPSRVSSRRRGKDEAQDTEQEADEEPDAAEESDEPEVDDTEAAAKSEEEQAKRMAAMDGLGVLERHFAALRDRLYDERISAINHELQQLTEPVPSHPELLKQLEVVSRYRDEKIETEQKLLVYKVGALKNKSVAERAQIHSAYFQTARDIREKHLERLSERFYRIQRERFRSNQSTPNYTIPFATRRSKQITQQTAYNKEVSILSGVAKYVGFPAAPDLAQSSSKEIEDDLAKMGLKAGVSSTQYCVDWSNSLTTAQMPSSSKTVRATQRVTSNFSNISAPAAEEQFLEKNPWANAQHPAHRLGISRQNSSRSPLPDSTFLTPSNQDRLGDKPSVVGSASTIAEYPSSQLHTPHDNSTKNEYQLSSTYAVNGRRNSASPVDMRRNMPSAPDGQIHGPMHEANSSPLASRLGAGSPQRPGLNLADAVADRSSIPAKAPGITTGPGLAMSRF